VKATVMPRTSPGELNPAGIEPTNAELGDLWRLKQAQDLIDRYQAAGEPYGHTMKGLVRWLTELTPDEETPDEETPDEVTPDEVTPDEVTPDEVTPDEVTPDEVTPDEVTPTAETPPEGN